MRQPYRICRNCGTPLTPDQAWCPHCGAQYVEPIVQQPGEFGPSPPEQPVAPRRVGPYASQQPAPPYQRPPASYPANYAQQAPMSPGPEQVERYPQPPTSQPSIGPGVVIIFVVVALLLFVSIGTLFYNVGQQHGSQPSAPPTPGITPTAAPTHAPTPVPTRTPLPTRTPIITPTPTAFQAPTTGITVNQLSNHHVTSISFPKTGAHTFIPLNYRPFS